MALFKLDRLRRFQWRNMTTQELIELKNWLALRRAVIADPPLAEYGFIFPEEPDGVFTAEGAAYWAIGIIWQDRPWLLVFGTLALVGKILLESWNLTRVWIG